MNKRGNEFYTITELSEIFGISTRAIRFYETKALLNPVRVGGNRAYSYSDKVRLSLILRSKRLGFSLNDIGEYIMLYDVDPDHREQITLLLEKVSNRLALLEQQKEDLSIMIQELGDIKHQCKHRLDEMGE